MRGAGGEGPGRRKGGKRRGEARRGEGGGGCERRGEASPGREGRQKKGGRRGVVACESSCFHSLCCLLLL